MDRVMIVSSDCHTGIPTDQYRDYLEQRYHADLDEFDARKLAADEGAQSFPDQVLDDREDIAARCDFIDSAGRLRDLEENGVVAEVLFPGASPATTVPWTDFLACGAYTNRGARALELQWAGEKAYNRWLAEFCADTPNRRAGLAHLPLHDVDASVTEIHWAAEHGLRGVLLPEFRYDVPEYCMGWHWDRIWAACSETGLSVNFHGGYGLPEIGTHTILMLSESSYFSKRPVWHMILTGVFDRFPGLNVAITESSALWVPDTLNDLDAAWERELKSHSARTLLFRDDAVCRRPPHEYWHEHFHVGASLLSFDEMRRRHEIGLHSMMYGNDYPHPEGTWGRQTSWLQAALGRAGGTEEEARLILGENAARLYHFEVEPLRRRAQEVGPQLADVLHATTDEETAALVADADTSGRILASQHLAGTFRPVPSASR